MNKRWRKTENPLSAEQMAAAASWEDSSLSKSAPALDTAWGSRAAVTPQRQPGPLSLRPGVP